MSSSSSTLHGVAVSAPDILRTLDRRYLQFFLDCKSLAPIYEKVAQDFALDNDVVIAKIDCDAADGKSTSTKYGIGGFPTLKFFPKGSTEPIDYNGGRTEADILSFINEHAVLTDSRVAVLIQ